MKQIKLLLVMLVLGMIVMTGCGESKPAEPVNITIWHYYNGDIKSNFDDMVELFNSTVGEEKGIVVDAYTQSGVNELSDAVLAAAKDEIGTDDMPDIFASYPDTAYDADKLGIVANLDKYFTDKELSEYRTEFLENGRFGDDEALKIFPVAKSTELLFVNDTVFQEFSLATGTESSELQTWEGLVAVAEKYYNWSGGKSFFGIDSPSNFMIEGIRQQGDEIFTIEDGKTIFNFERDKAKRLWDNYYVPFVKGYFAAEGRFRSDDLKNGKIVCFTGSTSSASYFPKEIETGKDVSYPIDSLVMEYPYFDEKFAIEQGAGMVVVKNDENIENACVEFLKWFTAEEQNIKFAVETSYLPVKNEPLSYEKIVNALGDDTESAKYKANKVAIEMLGDYELYATRPFENGGEARKLLNSSLSDLAMVSRAEIIAKADQGLIDEYISEESFDKWYKTLTEDMEKLIR